MVNRYNNHDLSTPSRFLAQLNHLCFCHWTICTAPADWPRLPRLEMNAHAALVTLLSVLSVLAVPHTRQQGVNVRLIQALLQRYLLFHFQPTNDTKYKMLFDL